MPALAEDTPLSESEAADVARCLASLPAALRAVAFGGDAGALGELAARTLRGEGPARAPACMRETLEWRERVGADTAHIPGAAAFHAAWPSATFGRTVSGHLLWCERLADIRIHDLLGLSDDELVLHRAVAMETLHAAKRAAATAAGFPRRLYCKHVFVLDVSGLHSGLLLGAGCRRVLRAVNSVSSKYYTETLLVCYAVNVHPAARLAWAALRGLVHPDTARKVRLLGRPAEAAAAVASELGAAADALPAWLGGTHPGRPLGGGWVGGAHGAPPPPAPAAAAAAAAASAGAAAEEAPGVPQVEPGEAPPPAEAGGGGGGAVGGAVAAC